MCAKMVLAPPRCVRRIARQADAMSHRFTLSSAIGILIRIRQKIKTTGALASTPQPFG